VPQLGVPEQGRFVLATEVAVNGPEGVYEAVGKVLIDVS
jgi:hypothetical protein